MQTRKRGRKRIDGGIQLSNPFKRAPTQIVDPVDANGLLLEDSAIAPTAHRNNLTLRALASVGTAAGKLGSAVVNGTKATGKGLATGAKATGSAVGSGVTSFGNAFNGLRAKPQAPANVTGTLDAAAPTAPAPSSSAPAPPATVKIKPDNLLVPMVINLENNYVLVGALKFKITDGNVFKQYIKNAYDIYIKNAYDIYINQATQSLSDATDAMPSNEQIKAAVRNKVMDEFKGSIMEFLKSRDLDSVADKANNAIELDMGDLFYEIQCIILSGTSDDAKITAINSLIEISIEQDAQKLQEAMIKRPVGTMSPETDVNVTIPTGNPEQVIKNPMASDTNQVPLDGLPPTDRILDEDKDFEANASKTIEKEKDQDFEGGARSKKTRKRRQKRSKRKTVHHLRKRR
jgi:hypothetical protein